MKKLILIILILSLPMMLFADRTFKNGNELYKAKQYDKALGEYSQFITKNPKYYEGYYNAGNALFNKEKYEEALSMYQKAEELKPKDEDVKHNIKAAEQRIRHKEKSKEQDKKNQENKDKKDGKDNKDGDKGKDKKDGKDSKDGQKHDGKKGKQQKDNQQGSKGEKVEQREMEEGKKPPEGMTEDEVQAVLNMMQKQEKKYNQYFGKQKKSNKQMDVFEMMRQRVEQADPNNHQKKSNESGEKDW